MKIHCKYDELVPASSLKPFDRNRNIHTPEQIERLAKLLEFHGMRAPIVVAKAPFNCIAKGHGTLAALKANGITDVPVVYQSFDDYDSLYAFCQSDNAIAAWSDLDLAAINVDIPELGPFDIALLGIEKFSVDVSEIDPANPSEGKPAEPIECPACHHVFQPTEA